MIRDKEELKRCLILEKQNYLGERVISHMLGHTKNYAIWNWQYHLRKEEYYYGRKNNPANKLLYFWHKRKKNILGQKLGFDIPANCFDIGLVIHHVSPVTVNADAVIGKNCDIAGSVCVGSKSGGVPVIGDNCILGYGSTVLGGIKIGNNVTVGAGAVVLHSFREGSVLAGVPAIDLRDIRAKIPKEN